MSISGDYHPQIMVVLSVVLSPIQLPHIWVYISFTQELARSISVYAQLWVCWSPILCIVIDF